MAQKIPIAGQSALAQTEDFAIPPFDYHRGANADATTGGILFHTFEGGVNCGALTLVFSAASQVVLAASVITPLPCPCLYLAELDWAAPPIDGLLPAAISRLSSFLFRVRSLF